MKRQIIVIGMARSGTSLVSHLLGSSPETYCEIEPHMVWKSGSFWYLGDEVYSGSEKKITWIRKKLLSNVKDKILVEKSPPNCLRPSLVHSVFPEAKVVYIERDPIRCIDSNYKRSLNKDSLKLSIVLKKYFLYSGSTDLSGAIGRRSIFSQLGIEDIIPFIYYSLRMFFIRNISRSLPFGPKITGYRSYVKKNGLLDYHVRVYIESLKRKKIFEKLYGKNMAVFKLEKLFYDTEETRRLYDFCGLNYHMDLVQEALISVNKSRVEKALEKGERDEEIERLIQKYRYQERSK